MEQHTWGEKMEEWDRHEAQAKAELLRRHGLEREQDLPVNVEGLVLQAQEDDDAPAFDRAYGELFATFARQDRVLIFASVLAPQLAVQSASMAAAGTDTTHDVDFWWSVERYRRGLVRTVNDYATHTLTHGAPLLAGRGLWAQIPPFVYRPPPGSLAARSSWGSLLVLLGWTLGAAWWARRGARAMEVGE
jgi:ABC-2 type transport system permease protein